MTTKTIYAQFESEIRLLNTRMAKDPNDRKPIREALGAIKAKYSTLLTMNNKAVSSYNIIAEACESDLLPRIRTASKPITGYSPFRQELNAIQDNLNTSVKVQKELEKINTIEEAEEALKQLEEMNIESIERDFVLIPNSEKTEGWMDWIWSTVNYYMGWSAAELQELRSRLEMRLNSRE